MATTDKKTVKNVSGVTLEVMGYGVVEADGVIEVPVDFNNANFEAVKVSPKNKKDDTETKE